MCICTSIISMCKYLNRTLMTCRFNYPQLVDGSLISPHEGPGPGVLPTSGGLSCGTGVFDGHVGTTSRRATGHGGGGMVEIQSTLRACEVWWSLFGTVWNHCSDECESLLPLPKKCFQLCCFSWQQVWDGAKRFCKFWGHLLILQVCTMLQTAERWLQVNVKIAYLQEIPTTFATSGVVLLCFFAGKQCDSLIVQSFASRTRSIPSWVRVYPGRPGQGSKPPKVIGQELGWKPRILGCHVFFAWSALYFCSTRHKVTNKGQTF